MVFILFIVNLVKKKKINRKLILHYLLSFFFVQSYAVVLSYLLATESALSCPEIRQGWASISLITLLLQRGETR